MGVANISISVTEDRGKARKYDLDSDLDGKLSLQEFFDYTKRVHVAVSKEVIKDAVEAGFDKKYTLLVDNKRNKVEEDVKYFGTIEYVASVNIREALMKAYAFILDLSKVRTGQYKRSNDVYFNGKIVAGDMKEFEAWLKTVKSFEPRDRIRFVNTAPYANKLELEGVTANGTNKKMSPRTDKKGRPRNGGKSFRKPNGVYWIAARTLKRYFKGNLFVVHQNILGSELGLTSPAKGSGMGRVRQRGRDKGRTYVYPSIYLQITTSGTH